LARTGSLPKIIRLGEPTGSSATEEGCVAEQTASTSNPAGRLPGSGRSGTWRAPWPRSSSPRPGHGGGRRRARCCAHDQASQTSKSAVRRPAIADPNRVHWRSVSFSGRRAASCGSRTAGRPRGHGARGAPAGRGPGIHQPPRCPSWRHEPPWVAWRLLTLETRMEPWVTKVAWGMCGSRRSVCGRLARCCPENPVHLLSVDNSMTQV
jgi:hypothetical protein